MKSTLTVLLLFACAWTARAGQETAQDLIAVFKESIGTAAHGELTRAMLQLNSQSRSPKSPKEVSDDGLQNSYSKAISALGELDEVEQMSSVFTGESLFRVRFLEKRAEGVVLWTLIGYRFKGKWYLKGLKFNSSDDLVELMHEEMDSADVNLTSKEKIG